MLAAVDAYSQQQSLSKQTGYIPCWLLYLTTPHMESTICLGSDPQSHSVVPVFSSIRTISNKEGII